MSSWSVISIIYHTETYKIDCLNRKKWGELLQLQGQEKKKRARTWFHVTHPDRLLFCGEPLLPAMTLCFSRPVLLLFDSRFLVAISPEVAPRQTLLMWGASLKHKEPCAPVDLSKKTQKSTEPCHSQRCQMEFLFSSLHRTGLEAPFDQSSGLDCGLS